MRRKMMITLVVGITLLQVASAQNVTVIQYINTYKFIAIKEMQRSGVPASIKLAQGILETQAGESDLVQRSNNHFGIKCKTAWSGNKVYHDDDERGECFRAYANAEDSYKDHSDFLKNSPRYSFLFDLNPEDYEGWAKGLKRAGYATNPKYTQQLIKYIEDYNLNLYTQIALGKKTIKDESAMYAVNGTVTAPPVTVVAPAATTKNYPKQALHRGEVQSAKAIYPQGKFYINETKVILAPAGSSLLAIAETYNVKYRHLLDFNEFEEGDDVLDYDQLIFLQRKRKQGAAEFHIVQPGEDMYDIAQAEGVRLDNLLEYNNLDADDVPMEGQRVYLQKKAASHAFKSGEKVLLQTEQVMVNAGEQMPANNTMKHIVVVKETLYSIAKKYAVGIDQLKSWNSLQGNDLKPGQELIIYKN